jgi:hypothetical protein
MADRDIDLCVATPLEDSWQAHFNWRTGSATEVNAEQPVSQWYFLR